MREKSNSSIKINIVFSIENVYIATIQFEINGFQYEFIEFEMKIRTHTIYSCNLQT